MRYTVLTYIFGKYDIVHEILEKDDNADYILVTDDVNLKSKTWTIVYDPMDGKSVMEKCYFVRFHPFLYAKTEYVIRLDASILIKFPLDAFIKKMISGNYDRCLMIHPRRCLMKDEYEAWIRKGYERAQANKCLHFMERLGYDMQYKGLFQCCFEVVKNNDINEETNDITYNLLRIVSSDGRMERVDQTFLSFVINHLLSEKVHILPISQNVVTDGKLMNWFEHKSFRKRTCGVSIKPMLFNKKCSTWTPIL